MNQQETINKRLENVQRTIWVTFQKEGIHCYPDAATNPQLADVAFLSHPHRHIFHFRVGIAVAHNDRDIEFIQFKRWLENLYSGNILNLDHKSCEMIGEELFTKIAEKYPSRRIEIEVSEDGENGATLKFGV